MSYDVPAFKVHVFTSDFTFELEQVISVVDTIIMSATDIHLLQFKIYNSNIAHSFERHKLS